jgi:hypothetical protein
MRLNRSIETQLEKLEKQVAQRIPVQGVAVSPLEIIAAQHDLAKWQRDQSGLVAADIGSAEESAALLRGVQNESARRLMITLKQS